MREWNPRRETSSSEPYLRSATVVFDTNVLLGLYRLTATSREDALAVLELPSLRDRVWLPHQVVVEFYRNLPSVRGRVAAAYQKAGTDLRSGASAAKASFARESRSRDAKAEIAKLIDEGVEALVAALDGLASMHQPLNPDGRDAVLERIERLFEQHTGPKPDDQTIRARVEEFVTWRAPNQIPPGYKDLPEKHTPLLRAGDYLLWCELLDRAERTETPFLFVTEDGKPDWWEGEGQPRAELSREFSHRNGAGYHQVAFEVFLADAREHLGAAVSSETVEEVVAEREAAESEEAGRLMELWARRARENRDWVGRGLDPIHATGALGSLTLPGLDYGFDPSALSPLQRTLAEVSAAVGAGFDVSALSPLQRTLAEVSAAVGAGFDVSALSPLQRAIAEADAPDNDAEAVTPGDGAPREQGPAGGPGVDSPVRRKTPRAASGAPRALATGAEDAAPSAARSPRRPAKSPADKRQTSPRGVVAVPPGRTGEAVSPPSHLPDDVAVGPRDPEKPAAGLDVS